MRVKPCEGDHHGQPRRVSGVAGSLSDSMVSSYRVSLLFSIEYAPGGRPKTSRCAWKRTILGWASCQRIPPSKCGQIGVLIAGALRACETYYVSRAWTAVDQPPCTKKQILVLILGPATYKYFANRWDMLTFQRRVKTRDFFGEIVFTSFRWDFCEEYCEYFKRDIKRDILRVFVTIWKLPGRLCDKRSPSTLGPPNKFGATDSKEVTSVSFLYFSYFL